MEVTSVAACSPPAPSPTAASSAGVLFVATGAVGGVNEPVGVGGFVTPLAKVRLTVVADKLLAVAEDRDDRRGPTAPSTVSTPPPCRA